MGIDDEDKMVLAVMAVERMNPTLKRPLTSA